MQKLPCNTMLNYIFSLWYSGPAVQTTKMPKCEKMWWYCSPEIKEAPKKCDNVRFSLNLFKWWKPINKELKLILKRNGQNRILIWTDLLQSKSKNNGSVVQCWNWTIAIATIWIPTPHAFWGENWQKLKTDESITKISVSSNRVQKQWKTSRLLTVWMEWINLASHL